MDDVAHDEVPGPLTDALTTAFGSGDVQVKYIRINFRNTQAVMLGAKIELFKQICAKAKICI